MITSLLENKLKMLNGLDDEVNSLCPPEDITNEIEESEDIVAQIIEESRKSVDCQVPSVVASPSTVYVQPNQHNTTASNSVKP